LIDALSPVLLREPRKRAILQRLWRSAGDGLQRVRAGESTSKPLL